MGVKNAGQEPTTQVLPGIAAPQSTGMGGSAGVTAAEGAPPLASVQVSIPGASSQAAIPTADVNVGDTYSSSSDQTPKMWAGNNEPQDGGLPWRDADSHAKSVGHPNNAMGA